MNLPVTEQEVWTEGSVCRGDDVVLYICMSFFRTVGLDEEEWHISEEQGPCLYGFGPHIPVPEGVCHKHLVVVYMRTKKQIFPEDECICSCDQSHTELCQVESENKEGITGLDVNHWPTDLSVSRVQVIVTSRQVFLDSLLSLAVWDLTATLCWHL